MDIYIGNLNPQASETQIKDLFKDYGQIQVAVIMDDGGHSKGYAIVTIDSEEAGLLAVAELNQQNFMNYYLEVSVCR